MDIEKLTMAELYELQFKLNKRFRDLFQAVVDSGFLDEHPSLKSEVMISLYNELTPVIDRNIANRWLLNKQFIQPIDNELNMTISELEVAIRNGAVTDDPGVSKDEF